MATSAIIEVTDDKIEKKEMERIILIEVPKNAYGELRKIFVNLFERSGFKDVKISENVDFENLYNLRRVQ